MPQEDLKSQVIERVGFNRYFKAGSWEEYNRQFFNGLAPKYDRLNQVITLGKQQRYKSQVIGRVPISDGDLVLDVCTGSGDLALLVAERYPSSHVVGVDVANRMLDIAREKSQHLRNVEFQQGDAMRLPFPDKSFDVSVMGYGLRNLLDIKQGIKELVRVTRPGGSISILDLGKPQSLIEKAFYTIFFEKLMPFLGKHIFHRGEFNSFQYLPESNKFFPPVNELVAMMEICGIREVRTYKYMTGVVSQWVGTCR